MRKKHWIIVAALIGILFVVVLINFLFGAPTKPPYQAQPGYGTEANKLEEIWGVKKWTKIFKGPCIEAYSIQQASDEGYVIGGATISCTKDSNGTTVYQPFLFKTDSNGNKIWEERYKGFALSIQQTIDGGYVAAGTINLPREKAGAFGAKLQADVYLLKTAADGKLVWEKNYGEDKNEGEYFLYTLDEGRSVQQISDGGYIIAGDTRPYGMGSDIYLIKTDGNGNLQWKKVFNGNKRKHAHSAQQTSNGGYIVLGDAEYGTWSETGIAEADIFLVKIDETQSPRLQSG